MKYFSLLAVLLMIGGVQNAACEEWSESSNRTTTLTELAKMPGVKIKIEPFPKPEEDFIPGADPTHPINEVTLLFFPGAKFFGPDFFKNFRGAFSLPSETPSMYSSGLKIYLFVRGADRVVLAQVPVDYKVTSDGDASDTHFKITFMITAEAMKYSDLWVMEVEPRSGSEYPTIIHLGPAPEKK